MIRREVTRMATFACTHCNTLRPYGNGEEIFQLLNCLTCKVPTRHQFVEINEWESQAEEQPGDGKILSITFRKASRA
jgi:hypothetical protein